MLKYWQDRLREPSTWRGLILCLGAFGLLNITPDQQNALLALVFALAGSVGVATKD